jgi:hypothetical protein
LGRIRNLLADVDQGIAQVKAGTEARRRIKQNAQPRAQQNVVIGGLKERIVVPNVPAF